MRQRGSPTATSSGGERSANSTQKLHARGPIGLGGLTTTKYVVHGTGRSGRSEVAPIGVLGGAFIPPHVGHLLLAQEARWQLGLDEVLLMVTPGALKELEDDPGAEVRLKMARLAAEGEEGAEASDLEVSRDEVSYSYRTLELWPSGTR